MLPAQAIKLNKSADISNALVRVNAPLIDTVLSLLSYALAFKENYGVQFVDEHMLEMVGDKMYLNIIRLSSGKA